MAPLIKAIVATMCLMAPPGRPTWVPDARETEAEARTRYASIASDLVAVVDSEGSVSACSARQRGRGTR